MERAPSKKRKKRARNEPEEDSENSSNSEGPIRSGNVLQDARGDDEMAKAKRRVKKDKLSSKDSVAGLDDFPNTEESGDRSKKKRKKELDDENNTSKTKEKKKKKKEKEKRRMKAEGEDLGGIFQETKEKKSNKKRVVEEDKECCGTVCSSNDIANEKGKKKRKRKAEEVLENEKSSRDPDASNTDGTSVPTTKRKERKRDAENGMNDSEQSHASTPGLERKKKTKGGTVENNTNSDKGEKTRANNGKGEGRTDGTKELLLMGSEQEDMEKKEKKRKKGKKQSSDASEREGTSKADGESQKEPAVHPALIYLDCWKNDRKNWRFKKVRQVWLLHNMFTADKVSGGGHNRFSW